MKARHMVLATLLAATAYGAEQEWKSQEYTVYMMTRQNPEDAKSIDRQLYFLTDDDIAAPEERFHLHVVDFLSDGKLDHYQLTKRFPTVEDRALIKAGKRLPTPLSCQFNLQVTPKEELYIFPCDEKDQALVGTMYEQALKDMK